MTIWFHTRWLTDPSYKWILVGMGSVRVVLGSVLLVAVAVASILEIVTQKWSIQTTREANTHGETRAETNRQLHLTVIGPPSGENDVHDKRAPKNESYFSRMTPLFSRQRDTDAWYDALNRTCAIDWNQAVDIQLKNWRDSGITLGSLNKYCARSSTRVSIHNHEIRAAAWKFQGSGASRYINALWLIQMVCARAEDRDQRIPNLELVMQSGDGAQSTVIDELLWDDAGPLFGSTKCLQDASVSFPMNFHDQFGAGGGAMWPSTHKKNWNRLCSIDRNEWDSKDSKLFFSAGHGTGQKRAIARGYRRALFQINSPLMEVTEDSISLEENAKYKYLVYAFGRCGWSRRIHELAFFKSVVFIEESNCSEYFMSSIDPESDYIPVATDFSNLEGRLTEVHANQTRALKLGLSWRAKIHKVFSLECILDYVETLLRRYAELQRFNPIRRTE